MRATSLRGCPVTARRTATRLTRKNRARDVSRKGDLGGAYGDSFGDVDALLMNYFTFRALKETLAQMQETDLSPGKGEYKWLYNFAAAEYQNRGDEFIQKLFKEGRSDHAQRILAQRVVLLKRWTSYFNRGRGSDKCYEKFESKNLELLREQLFCTVNLSDDALATDECDKPMLYRKIIEDAEQDENI